MEMQAYVLTVPESPGLGEVFADHSFGVQLGLICRPPLFLGLRRGGPDSESGGEARGEHADERLREPHVQVLRGVGVRGRSGRSE